MSGSPSGGSSFSARHHVGTAGGAGSLGASGALRSPGGASSFRSGNIPGGSFTGSASARAAGSSFAARHAANIGGAGVGSVSGGVGGGSSRFNGSRPGGVGGGVGGGSGIRPTGPGSSGLSGAIQRTPGTAGRIAGSGLASASSFYNRHRVGSSNGPSFGGRPGSLNGSFSGSRDGSRSGSPGGSPGGSFNGSSRYYGPGAGGTNFNAGRYGYNNFGYGGGYGRYAGANRFGYGNYGYNRYGYGGFGGYSGLGGYGGYGRYGYGRYGLGSTVLNVVNYGLGYGGYGLGYGGYGYSPYGYGGYGYGYRPWGGYYGYPWGFIASRVLFGIRPLLGLGFGYDGYGYGNNYGNSYYSTYSPVVTTEVPVATTDVPVVELAAVDPTLAANSGDYAAQGEADFQAGNYAGAVKNWQHALVEDPDNATLVMMLSQGFFATSKYDEAAGALQAALQGVPQDKWNTVVGNYRELYGNAQDYTDQLRALEAASEKTESPAMQFLLGYHYGFLGFPKEAVRELDKGLKLAPEDVLAKQLRDMFAPKTSTPPAAVIPKS